MNYVGRKSLYQRESEVGIQVLGKVSSLISHIRQSMSMHRDAENCRSPLDRKSITHQDGREPYVRTLQTLGTSNDCLEPLASRVMTLN